jgi:glycosyltransferase involved in cell wall biosynthesis
VRPLKIALLSRWYAEENRRTGGAGSVQQLAEAVAALGHEVVVLSQSKTVAALEQSRIGALETWLSPREKRRWGWTGLRDKLAKGRYGHRKVHSDALDLRDFLAARGPFDVLWAQCEEPDGLVAAIAEKMGVKLPPTLTQIYALRYDFERAQPKFNEQAALQAAFRQARRIIANSELVAESIAAYAGPDLSTDVLCAKTHVVYHNLTREFLVAAHGEESSPEPGRVLFLGAINEKKGAYPFLMAAQQVRTPNVNFAVAGNVTDQRWRDGRLWEDEVRASRARIKLELLGAIPAQETIAQIRRASVVVLPSLFDEFSRALVEALVLGRPVVTTEKVGAAVFVRNADAGVVVRPGDAVELARGIDHALGNSPFFTGNARAYGPRLAHELSPQAIALQMVRHMTEIVAP